MSDGPRDHAGWPEPATSLYARARKTIRGAIADAARDGHGAKIGGGTVLALRWSHRRSEDIDLAVAATPSPSWWNTVGEEMKAAGCRRAATPEDGSFDPATRPAGPTPVVTAYIFDEGKIDVSTTPLKIDHGHGVERVAGDELTLLSNTQILAGKLWDRGLHAPVRDLYDYAVAAVEDPGALAAVTDAEPGWALQTMIDRWWNDREELRNQSFEITGTPPAWRAAATDPSRHAVAAILDAASTRTTMRTERGRAIIERKTRTGLHTIEFDSPAELEKWWNETAQDRMAAAVPPHPHPGKILNDLKSGMDTGQNTIAAELLRDSLRKPDGWTPPGPPTARHPRTGKPIRLKPVNPANIVAGGGGDTTPKGVQKHQATGRRAGRKPTQTRKPGGGLDL